MSVAKMPMTDALTVLEVISERPLDGYDIVCRLAQRVHRCWAEHGAIYLTLHKLERDEWLQGHWVISDSTRRSRQYSLTPAGRRVLHRSKMPAARRRPVGGAASLLVCSVAVTASAPNPGGLPHVRSSSPLIRALVVHGINESPTFRQLTETIERSNGIVYVENGRCRHGVNSCLVFSLTPAGGFRFLRIVVKADDTTRSTDDLIASLGHEFRHAIEVLSEPHVNSAGEMFCLYLHLSALHDGHFETVAAIDAGNQIARELSHVP